MSTVFAQDEWGEAGERLVSVNAVDASWPVVVEDVCEQAEVGLIMPAGTAVAKEGSTVTLKVWNGKLRDVLQRLASLQGYEPVLADNVVRFEVAGVRAFGVIDPGYLTTADAATVLKAVSPTESAVSVAGPNIVVSGSVEGVERGQKVAEAFAGVEPGQWLASVYVLEISETLRDRMGIEFSLSGAVEGLLSSDATTAIAKALLSGTIAASHNRSIGKVLNHASVMLVEGTATTLRNVTSVPVPKKTVSDQGTVTTSDFQFIEAGLIIDLAARRVPGGRVFIDCKPELSTVTGFVQEAPIISKRTMTFSAMIRPGDFVLVSGLDEVRQSTSHDGLFELSKGTQKDRGAVVIILHLSAVSAGVVVTPPPEIP